VSATARDKRDKDVSGGTWRKGVVGSNAPRKGDGDFANSSSTAPIVSEEENFD